MSSFPNDPPPEDVPLSLEDLLSSPAAPVTPPLPSEAKTAPLGSGADPYRVPAYLQGLSTDEASQQETGPAIAMPSPAFGGGATIATADEPRRSSRRWWLLGGIGALMLAMMCLAVGAVAAWARFSQAQRHGVAMLPADTQVYLSVNPNLSALPGVQRFQELYAAEVGDESEGDPVSERRNDWAENLGVTFEEDVQPWLGMEALVAARDLEVDPSIFMMGMSMDPTGAEEAAQNGTIIVLLASKDNAAAQAFLDKVQQYRVAEFDESYSESDYQGITIGTLTPADATRADTEWSFALVKDFVVASTELEALHEVIDLSRDDKASLAKVVTHNNTMNSLPDDGVAYAYVSAELVNQVTEASQEMNTFTPSLPNQAQVEATSKAFEGYGLALTTPKEGFRLHFITKLDLTRLNDDERALINEAALTPLSDDIYTTIHKDALVVMLFSLNEQTTDLMAQAMEQAGGMGGFDALEEEMGIDIQRDIFSWLRGQMAMVLLSNSDNATTANSSGMSGYLVVRPPNMEEARSGIGRLVSGLNESSYADSTAFQTETIGTHNWNTLVSDSGWGDTSTLGGVALTDDTVFVGGGEDGMRYASGAAQNPITSAEMFEQARRYAVEPRGYFVYINARQARALINKVSEQVAEYSGEPSDPLPYIFDSVIFSAKPGFDATGLTEGQVMLIFRND